MVLNQYLKYNILKIQTGLIGDSLKDLKETLELFITESEDTMDLFMLKVGALMFQLKIYMMHMLTEIQEEM